MPETVQQLRIEAIQPSPFQYRRDFNEAELSELRESIATHGLLQPVLARPVRGKKSQGVTHQLVAGHRRLMACKQLGHSTIAATVRPMSDLEAAGLTLVENTQRDDPDDWATAQGIRSLMELSATGGQPMSEADVARMLNKSLSYVRNHLGLFKLRPALQEVAQKHALVKSSLFEIQKVDDAATERKLLDMVEKGAGFQQIKREVDTYLSTEQWKRESSTPHHSQRNGTQHRTETKSKAATRQVAAELRTAERALRNAAAWLENVSRADYEREVKPAVERVRAMAGKL